MTERRWHPWRALRERDHVRLMLDPCVDDIGAVYGHRGEHAVIIISPGLDPTERRCALAHELVHDERRVTRPDATDATMQTEERQVRRETARRLVPLDELHELVTARTEVEPVTVHTVAVEFDVTEAVAAEAVRQLQARLLLERELEQTIAQRTRSPGTEAA